MLRPFQCSIGSSLASTGKTVVAGPLLELPRGMTVIPRSHRNGLGGRIYLPDQSGKF